MSLFSTARRRPSFSIGSGPPAVVAELLHGAALQLLFWHGPLKRNLVALQLLLALDVGVLVVVGVDLLAEVVHVHVVGAREARLEGAARALRVQRVVPVVGVAVLREGVQLRGVRREAAVRDVPGT